MTKPFLKPKEATEYLQISLHDLHELRKKGTGPTYYKLSNKIFRYKLEDLNQWIDQNLVPFGQSPENL